MFKRTEGKTLRLRPEATGPHGERLDDDWAVAVDLLREAATLTNARTGMMIGFDQRSSETRAATLTSE